VEHIGGFEVLLRARQVDVAGWREAAVFVVHEGDAPKAFVDGRLAVAAGGASGGCSAGAVHTREAPMRHAGLRVALLQVALVYWARVRGCGAWQIHARVCELTMPAPAGSRLRLQAAARQLQDVRMRSARHSAAGDTTAGMLEGGGPMKRAVFVDGQEGTTG